MKKFIKVKKYDIPTQVVRELETCLYNKTRSYYYYAQYNENCKCFVFSVYKDYYKTLQVSYMGNDHRIHNTGVILEHERFTDIAENYLRNMLDNLKLCKDYDYINIMDAISCGDMDMIDDIIGDRDLAELL